MSTKLLFVFMSIAAFLSIISFFQVNSYLADRKKWNGLFKVLGVVFLAVAVFFLVKVIGQSGTGIGADGK